MRIEIESSSNFSDVDVIVKQLCRLGWSQVIENGMTYFALFRDITFHGHSRDVSNYKWIFKNSSSSIIFESTTIPNNDNLRTDNSIFRVLAGKIVSDLLRNDCLSCITYIIQLD